MAHEIFFPNGEGVELKDVAAKGHMISSGADPNVDGSRLNDSLK